MITVGNERAYSEMSIERSHAGLVKPFEDIVLYRDQIKNGIPDFVSKVDFITGAYGDSNVLN